LIYIHVATYAYYVNINHTAYSYMVNIGPSALVANAFTNAGTLVISSKVDFTRLNTLNEIQERNDEVRSDLHSFHYIFFRDFLQ